MASHSNTTCWEAPKFTFSSPQQSEEWRVFYIWPTDFLEALNINTEEDSTLKGWKQLTMTFQGKINRHSKPWYKTAPTSLRSRKPHGMSSMPLPQASSPTSISCTSEISSSWICASIPNAGIHALKTQIRTLINSCTSPCDEMEETLKIMLLQHVVRYHEAYNWIQQLD